MAASAPTGWVHRACGGPDKGAALWVKYGGGKDSLALSGHELGQTDGRVSTTGGRKRSTAAGDAPRGGTGRGSTRGARRAHLQTWPSLGSLKQEPTVEGSVDPSKECVCGQAVTGRGLSEKEHSSSWAADGPRSGERSIDPDTPSRGGQGSAGLGSGADPAVVSGGSEAEPGASSASCS